MPQGKQVFGDKTLDITRAKDAQCSPLAAALFRIDGVTRVFYGRDYISVSKKEEINWDQIKPMIFEAIMDQFSTNEKGEEKPLMLEDYVEAEDTKILDTDSEVQVLILFKVVQMIKEIIATRIRPTV